MYARGASAARRPPPNCTLLRLHTSLLAERPRVDEREVRALTEGLEIRSTEGAAESRTAAGCQAGRSAATATAGCTTRRAAATACGAPHPARAAAGRATAAARSAA